MTYRTIHLDIPIQIVSAPVVPDRHPPVAIDLGALLPLIETGRGGWEMDDVRRYYAAVPPLLLLIVARNNIDLTAPLPSNYIEAMIGWDDGNSPYTLSTHAGRQHTKITLVRFISFNLSPDSSFLLSSILANVPRLGQRGGNRPGSGRPALTGERMTSYDITLPRPMADWFASLAEGNLSAGIREAAQRAGYKEEPKP
jgi:hypothetical protein